MSEPDPHRTDASNTETLRTLVSIVSAIAGPGVVDVDVDLLEHSDRLVEGVAIDSLRLIELLGAIEDHYETSIEQWLQEPTSLRRLGQQIAARPESRTESA